MSRRYADHRAVDDARAVLHHSAPHLGNILAFKSSVTNDRRASDHVRQLDLASPIELFRHGDSSDILEPEQCVLSSVLVFSIKPWLHSDALCFKQARPT